MPSRPARLAGVALLGLAGLAAALGSVAASDHQDTPDVELNPKMDLTDVYAFPGSAPGRIALAMNGHRMIDSTPVNMSTSRIISPNGSMRAY